MVKLLLPTHVLICRIAATIAFVLFTFGVATPTQAKPYFATKDGGPAKLVIKKVGEDITKKTVNVYAGQLMALTVEASAGTIKNGTISWKVDKAGKPIEVWIGGDSTTYRQTFATNQPSVYFYWLKDGGSYDVIVNATVSVPSIVNGNNTVIDKPLYTFAKFNVKKPEYTLTTKRGKTFARTITNVPPGSDAVVGRKIGFGDINAGKDPGITFTATFPNGKYGGQVQWVQLLQRVILTETARGTVNATILVTSPRPALDTEYPYDGNVLSTNDSPSTGGISSNIIHAARNFKATMYLMWTPPPSATVPGVIPIPLAKIDWGFYVSAQENANGQWVLALHNDGWSDPPVAVDDEPIWTGKQTYVPGVSMGNN